MKLGPPCNLPLYSLLENPTIVYVYGKGLMGTIIMCTGGDSWMSITVPVQAQFRDIKLPVDTVYRR